MKRFIVVSQIYAAEEGSFSGFIKELVTRASKDFEVTILCGRRKGQPYREVLPYGTIIRFDVPNFPIFRSVLEAMFLCMKIRRFLRRNPPGKDALFLTNGEAALGVLKYPYVIRAGDQPVLAMLKNMSLADGFSSFQSRAARRMHAYMSYVLEHITIRRASGILFSSEKNRGLFIKYHGVSDVPSFVPRSGVDCKGMGSGKILPRKGKVLLFIALRDEKIRKGAIFLERSLPLVFAADKDAVLLHVGDRFEWNVPSWCKERIVSVGRVPWDRMKDYFATADIFVSCSISEGFPNAILEAMAAGLPIVTSNIIGIDEFIRNGKDGLVYDATDTQGLSSALVYLLKDKKLRTSMGASAKCHVLPLDYRTYSSELMRFINKPQGHTCLLMNKK
jgi:glycosyltransferase involved in cell wall biosynthesis